MDISNISADVYQALEAQFITAVMNHEIFVSESRFDDARHCEYLNGITFGIQSVMESFGTTKAEIAGLVDHARERVEMQKGLDAEKQIATQ